MIRSFRDKALRRFFESGIARGLSVPDTGRIRRILLALDVAGKPDDLNLPGFHFHGLSGQDKGRYSVRVTGNWRITFGWTDEDPIDVDLEDYH